VACRGAAEHVSTERPCRLSGGRLTDLAAPEDPFGPPPLGLGLRAVGGPVRLALVELGFPPGSPLRAGRSVGDGRHAALDLAIVGPTGAELGLFAPEDRPGAPAHRVPGLVRAVRRAVAWAGRGGVVLVEVQLETALERGVCVLEEPRLWRACVGEALVIVPSGNHAARVEASPPPNVLVVGAVYPRWVAQRGAWELSPAPCGWGPAVEVCAWGAEVPTPLAGEPGARHGGTSAAAALIAAAAVALRQRGVEDARAELLRVGSPPLDVAGKPELGRVGWQPDLSRFSDAR
jgi:hypothetical protein